MSDHNRPDFSDQTPELTSPSRVAVAYGSSDMLATSWSAISHPRGRQLTEHLRKATCALSIEQAPGPGRFERYERARPVFFASTSPCGLMGMARK
jgi:hypothetical protein